MSEHGISVKVAEIFAFFILGRELEHVSHNERTGFDYDRQFLA